MTEDKLRKKLRKKCKKLLKWAKRHHVHYVDISAFSTFDSAHAYANPTAGEQRIVVNHYDYSKEV